MTPITGAGWQNAIRVRMLHSAVRVRLADKRGVRNVYDAAVDGVPINQESVHQSSKRLLALAAPS